MEKRKKLLLVVVVSFILLVVAAGVGIKATSKPSFCMTCHEIEPAFKSWEASSHKMYGATCLDCHADKGEINLIKRKVSSVREIFIHLTDTPKPNEIEGNVPNSRCLECHSGKPDTKGKNITKFTGEQAIGHDGSTRCLGCHDLKSFHKK